MGVGFARDGDNNLKSNRSLVASFRRKFKEGQETFLKKGAPLKFKQISKDELERFRLKLRNDKKKDNIRTTLIVISVLGALLVLIFYMFF